MVQQTLALRPYVKMVHILRLGLVFIPEHTHLNLDFFEAFYELEYASEMGSGRKISRKIKISKNLPGCSSAFQKLVKFNLLILLVLALDHRASDQDGTLHHCVGGLIGLYA